MRRAIWTALRSDGHWSGEVLDRRRGGETFPAWVTANAVLCEQGGAGHYVSVARDITALKASEQQLQKPAFFDPLTGLANRALLNDRMGVALANAERKGEKVALLYIDLDRFKYVNDTLGHAAGDKLLTEISRRLAAQVRATARERRLRRPLPADRGPLQRSDDRGGGAHSLEQRDGSYIPPAVLIPHAEEVGLIKRLDCWVLERACRDVAEWSKRSGRSLEVSVNLSAISLQQPNLADQLRAILEKTRLAARQLRLEITETAVIANPSSAAEVLKRIRKLGVGISLDDFGTGYSSLNYLIQFPIDRIKLDGSFIGRIGKDPASEAIIHSLLELAERLGIAVVAEGVEHERQQDFLCAAGCGYVQGFHIARPLPYAELEELMMASPQNERTPRPARAA